VVGRLDLSAIEDWIVDGRTKGMPADVSPTRLADIGAMGWSVLRDDLPFPLATIRQSAVAHNSRWMRDFLKRTGAHIAPHGKTTMCPQLFQRQLDDGAWAVSVATAQQLKVCRDCGVGRVLMANQLVGRPEIRYVLDELKRDPDFRFLTFVDSVFNVTKLADAARAASLDRPLEVLLEIGFLGGRTGCRTIEDALDLARWAKRSEPHVALRGIAGFEGLLSRPTAAETEVAVTAFVDSLASIARAVESEKLFADEGPLVLSAGGSGFFDIVIDRLSRIGLVRETLIVIRSGCYLTHDAQMYRNLFGGVRRRNPRLSEIGPGLEPALEVWARVQSRPEAGKAILGVGKRDISFDIDLPAPVSWHRLGMREPEPIPNGHRVTGLNDQHCHMAIPENSPLQFGDIVSFGISHPCTTFDKWQVLYVVDDARNVVGALKTFF
jgi:D-serine dehydratase